jgi:hypothetical protein
MGLHLKGKLTLKTDLLMHSPHMTYTTKGGESYVADKHGIVTVAAHHTHELVACGGVTLLPIVKHDDGSTSPWTDPRIVTAPTN